MKKFNPNHYRITAKPASSEEKEFIELFNTEAEKGLLKTVTSSRTTKARLRSAARSTLAKNKNVTIRLNDSSITKIKERAQQIGIPYQTLIGSILHQFAEGKLKIEL